MKVNYIQQSDMNIQNVTKVREIQLSIIWKKVINLEY